MAAELTVSMRCLAPFPWLGQRAQPGQVLAMPPHVARAQHAAGRVAYVNPGDEQQITRAVSPPQPGVAPVARRR